MERLIRFTYAHDLLKKNVKRTQKLAQESDAALETYQRQVRTLEECLACSDNLYVCTLTRFDTGRELVFWGVTGRSKSSN
ncbi:hypothetical protein DFH94DRAFT_769115 [Russula ochroleuca]|jgi:hypothetical protein|uniref:Uncharacterized protein n=1 Tax=Russula ochroleuca TaxID=152965 RepID=A0A9P5JXY3_9AGAM|nr:hypothetical protein DFH94DRAFT_769115 [Russula ochroleuca]